MNGRAPGPAGGPRRLKIAVVTSSYPTEQCDFSGHFVANDVRELRNSGHAVTVIAPGTAPQSDPVSGVHHIYLGCEQAFGPPGVLFKLKARPLASRSLLAFTWRARRALARHGPWDQIVCHWLIPCGWPSSCGVAAEREWVAHGSDVRMLCRLPRPVAKLILRSVGDATRLRFVSQQLCQELSQHIGRDLSAESIIRPCPIDVSRAPKRTLARQQLGIAPDERLAVVVGRLIASKGVARALEHAARMPEVAAVVIGDGPERASLVHAFPGARFLGELAHSATLTWIAAADWLISGSREEGAPTAIREAGALGVAVIRL